jgi:hypothetical protein
MQNNDFRELIQKCAFDMKPAVNMVKSGLFSDVELYLHASSAPSGFAL